MGKVIKFRTSSDSENFGGIKVLMNMGVFVDSLELTPGHISITELIRKHGFANCTREELIKIALRTEPQTWQNKVFFIKALVDEWRLRYR